MSLEASAPVAKVSSQTNSRPWIIYAGVAVLIAYIGFTLLYRLPYNPFPHYDEGSFLKVARNFAQNGLYADFSSEGYRWTGPVISTGPTLILPNALVFKLFGPSLLAGRIVQITYTSLVLLSLFLLASMLADRRMALVAVAMFAIHPGIQIDDLGRIVMGEIPGLLYLFLALWMWVRPGKRTIPELVASGVLFGLTAITKNQYALFVLPGLLISLGLDLVWYRKRGWLHFVIPGILSGIMYGAWTYFSLYMNGAAMRNVAKDLADLRTLTGNSFFVLNGTIINNNIDYLVNGDLFLVPAVLYGIVLSLRRNEEGQLWSVITLLQIGAIIVYITSNVWWLYSVPARGISIILTGKMLWDLTGGFRLNWPEMRAFVEGKSRSLAPLASVVVVGFMAAMFLRPVVTQVHSVLSRGGGDMYDTVAYLKANMSKSDLIATWESELALETDLNYHNMLRSPLVNKPPVGPGSLPDSKQSIHDFVPANYVIIGELAKHDHLYDATNLTGYELVTTIGRYEIYRWKNS